MSNQGLLALAQLILPSEVLSNFEVARERKRDIRNSERNFYQQVTDIYATATDYDPRNEMTKMFFATVQNKLHYAVHENTAACRSDIQSCG